MGSRNLRIYNRRAYYDTLKKLIENPRNTCYTCKGSSFILDTVTGQVRRSYQKSVTGAIFVYSFQYDNQNRLCKCARTIYKDTTAHEQLSWQFNVAGQIISYNDSYGNMWDHTWGVDNIFLEHIAVGRNYHKLIQKRWKLILLNHRKLLEKYARRMQK
jgi:hypothetical protein